MSLARKLWVLGKILAVVAVGLVVVGLFLSREYEVERSILIQAHPIKIFTQVGILENWPAWNPWQDGTDPTYVVTLGDRTSGVGASQTCTSRHGAGEVRFTRTVPTQGIEYDFRFHDSWTAKAAVEFSPHEDGTLVTWRLRGRVEKPVIGGYLARMMDSMIGGMLDYGLKNLKKAVDADERELIFDDEAEDGPPMKGSLLPQAPPTPPAGATP
ncbi:MAG: SRPBCC family protein [Verrucomicrobia bacterium]|nr:SRPBCC family protein [Verrucomicrobiota bacterium]MBU1910173.1 SRPBCC family protein [Verrucomicrobiota bacterium]